MSNFIQYYKDPLLVARIQEFFGVEIHYENDKKKKLIKSKDDFEKTEENTPDENKSSSSINGYFNQESKSEVKKHFSEVQSSSDSPAEIHTSQNESTEPYTIKNYFWYYLFRFGTELGDEIFYATFIPFWFWNIDGAVGRKIVLIWSIIMTVGQALKEIFCWPRPSCPPAVRLQKKWALEYGMPSTHAMIAVAIPFSVVLFTINRYVYSYVAGFIAAGVWCTLICVSRLYLGMHTVLDVVVGFILALLMMILMIPIADTLDFYFLTNSWSLLALTIVSILIIVYFPGNGKWTPTRGDTTLIVAVVTGIYTGAWLNYKTGALTMPEVPPPYNIMWPTYPMVGKIILRTALGFSSIVGAIEVIKSLSYATMCAILQVNSQELKKSKDSLENKNKILVDLVYKYMKCYLVGIVIVCVLPKVYTLMGIGRPNFYTEL